MNRILLVAVCLALSMTVPAIARASSPKADVMLGPNGVVKVGKTEIRPILSCADWVAAEAKGAYALDMQGRSCFYFARGGARFADAIVHLSQLPEGCLRIDYGISFAVDVETETVGCSMKLPACAMEGRTWRVGSKRGVFARPETGGMQLAKGRFESLEFPLPESDAGLLRIATTNAVTCLIQDSRKWEDVYTVRVGDLSSRKYAKGDVLSFALVLSAEVPLVAVEWKPYSISAGEEWIPLDYCRDIEPGSALDFSKMGFADAPAGKYGWLKNSGGRFEFEKLPGVGQRFYGVNLVGTANFPDHELADALVARFKRLGYNTIRIHHHDAPTVEGSADGLTLNSANMDKLDYLVAASVREGIYITTDLYVSRKVKWRHIGIDQDGTIDIPLFKALCAVYEPAFRNWAAYAKNFMEHVNKYTCRRYADEPAMPLVSLVNEGGLFMGWTRGVRDDPRLLASWKAWLEAKRATKPGFAPGTSGDKLPEGFWKDGINPAVAEWTGELEARMVSRMKAYLRELGCKALLSNDNCGPHYAALQCATVDYDYVDDHFYVDHPAFPERRWALPSVCPNENPLLGSGTISPSAQAFTRMLDKPFTITEWNFSGPGRYRGVGGILAGAMAALQGWDGLWRFAYAHSREGLGNRDIRGQSYFDLASDPLAQASERACLCLFMRGDLEPLSKGIALLVTPESVSHGKVLRGAPEWANSAWSMRIGSCLSPEAAGGLGVVRREDAESEEAKKAVIASEAHTPLRIDRKRGAFTICTPRTCGGFAPEGKIDAGSLKAFVCGSPATVWVHSLDDEPICSSRRLLLTHLTDVQGDGATFADASMKVLLKWGRRPVVKAGTAEISLTLDEPESYDVYELATSGRRVSKMASSTSVEALRFTASVCGSDGARMMYEVLKRADSAYRDSSGDAIFCKSGETVLDRIPDVRILSGDARTAYRDPAIWYEDGTFHLFFTLVETEADRLVFSYVATVESRDLVHWTAPRKLTPRDGAKDYSSPGNVVVDGADRVLCFQSYPRPGNCDDGVVRHADQTARLFTMRSRDMRNWSAPQLIKVKGPDIAEKDMGRMIDPYLLQDRHGVWWCFYKQHGASISRSDDLEKWTPAGRTDAGENVCVLEADGRYVMFHSPKNGVGRKTSADLLHWTDEPGLITLGQKEWPWAAGRLTAGAVLDARRIPGVGKYLLFFHGSGPRRESEGDFDRNASIGLAWSDDLENWSWPGCGQREFPCKNEVNGLDK